MPLVIGSARIAAICARASGIAGVRRRPAGRTRRSGSQRGSVRRSRQPDSLSRRSVRLLSVSAQVTNCDHIGLLVGQRSRLARHGTRRPGCALRRHRRGGSAEILQTFLTCTTPQRPSVITSGGYTRLVYAIAEHGMTDTGHLQLGAMALEFQHPAGPVRAANGCPTVVTVRRQRAIEPTAMPEVLPRATTLRQRRIRARVRKPLAQTVPCPPWTRRRDAGSKPDVRARRAAIFADFPTTILPHTAQAS